MGIELGDDISGCLEISRQNAICPLSFLRGSLFQQLFLLALQVELTWVWRQISRVVEMPDEFHHWDDATLKGIPLYHQRAVVQLVQIATIRFYTKFISCWCFVGVIPIYRSQVVSSI